MAIFRAVYNLLWGDIIHIPLPGGSSLGLSLLVLILVPAGIYFTIRTRFLPFRMFPEMIKVTLENNKKTDREGISGVQALIVSTACRVGMGNLVGVVAAISAGGAGAVFWMWVIALVGSSTAFIEATLAQIYKEKDPLYGGYRGGPAYYIHHLFIKKNSLRKHSVVAVLFALSGLICWCGISQVIGNSISSSFENAFHVPPIYSTVVLVVIATVIVLRKNATKGLEGMDLLQTAMQYHLGEFGVIFIAVILFLFSFSTFLGILFYARPNVAYLFGDNWTSQTLYKVLALVMLFVGGLAAYQFVWDLGDLGVGLMTVFNMIALIPLAPKALASLKDYEQNEMKKRK